MTLDQRLIGSHNDYLERDVRISLGLAPTVTVVHKFGHNPSVGASFAPITTSGNYRTPQVSGATTLRVKAGGNANDTAAGTGAREITLQGLDATGAEVTDTLTTAGTSASAASSVSFLRLYRAYVSSSGTYATQSAASQAASITIENSAGTEDWFEISGLGFPAAQTEIACYSVPLGKRALLRGLEGTTETNKTCSILVFQRRNILETSAPYSAMREVLRKTGLNGTFAIYLRSPLVFPALTDVGVMGAVTTGTAAIEISFEIMLVDDI